MQDSKHLRKANQSGLLRGGQLSRIHFLDRSESQCSLVTEGGRVKEFIRLRVNKHGLPFPATHLAAQGGKFTDFLCTAVLCITSAKNDSQIKLITLGL